MQRQHEGPPRAAEAQKESGDKDMVTKDQLISTFRRVASEVAEKDFPDMRGETVIADLGIDSLAMLEIVGAMERELKIQIPDDQLVGIQTINDLIGLLQKRLPS